MISSTSLVSPNALLRVPGPRRSSSARSPSLPQRFASPRCAAAASTSRAAPPAATVTTASTTLYDVLGVAAAASGGEIKAAYRRLARECHPDAVAAERKGDSASEFIRLHAAYATLSDPEKRAEYDRSVVMATAAATLAASGARQRWSSPADGGRWPHYYSSGSSPVGGRRRTWETDQCW